MATTAQALGPKPSFKGPVLIAPLKIDEITPFEVWVFPNNNQALISSSEVLQALREYINEPAYLHLQRQLANEELLDLKIFEDLGIQATFDNKNLEVLIKIPLALRTQQSINLVSHPQMRDNQVSPAVYSGYLNAYLTQYLKWSGSANTLRQPLQGSLQFVQQWNRLVLDANFNLTEPSNNNNTSNPTHFFTRNYTRLVWDHPDLMLRQMLGDVQPSTAGYQTSPSLLGYTLSREFQMQPYRIVRPRNRTEIILKRPSTVEVFINNNLVKRIYLPAGPFDLRDYPLLGGLNDVQVKITDDLGQTENINLSLMYDTQMLAEGVHSFSYSLGFSKNAANSSQNNIFAIPAITLFHQSSLTDRFGLGANLQYSLQELMLGTEAYGLSPLGYYHLDWVLSKTNWLPWDWASRLRFRSVEGFNGITLPVRLFLELEYRGQNFWKLFERSALSEAYNPYVFRCDALLVHRLPFNFNLSWGGFYEFYRPITNGYQQDRKGFRFDFQRIFSENIRIFTQGELTYDQRQLAPKFSIGLTWNDRTGSLSFSSNYDSSQNALAGQLFRNPLRPYQDYRLNGNYQVGATTQSASLGGEYIAQRSRIGLLQNFNRQADLESDENEPSPQNTAQTETKIDFSSALVWTDQAIAISRPVTDSFAILPKSATLKDKDIPINHNGTFSEAIADFWGPAVLPNLISYYPQPVLIQSKGLPLGYTLGKEFYSTLPTYHSGVTIFIGVEDSIYLKGTLRDQNNNLITLQVGTLRSRETGKSFALFTNQKGRFTVEGLKAGNFDLTLNDTHWKSTEVRVQTQNAVGLLDVGNIILERIAEVQ